MPSGGPSTSTRTTRSDPSARRDARKDAEAINDTGRFDYAYRAGLEVDDGTRGAKSVDKAAKSRTYEHKQLLAGECTSSPDTGRTKDTNANLYPQPPASAGGGAGSP